MPIEHDPSIECQIRIGVHVEVQCRNHSVIHVRRGLPCRILVQRRNAIQVPIEQHVHTRGQVCQRLCVYPWIHSGDRRPWRERLRAVCSGDSML